MKSQLQFAGILAALAAGALAQTRPGVRSTPLPVAEAPSAEKCSVEGVVMNAASGEPIRKARVVAFPNNVRGRPPVPYAAMSDSTGRFVLQDIAAGTYRVFAERNGFVRAETGLRRDGSQLTASLLTLEPGKKIEGLVIRLTPGAVISGRVFDEDGDPIQGASVQAFRQQYVRGQMQMIPFNAVQTNDLGEYRLSGLSPGRTYLSVSYASPFGGVRFSGPEGGVAQTSANGEPQNQAYVPTYYPGVTEFPAAQPLTLIAGQEISRVEFSLRPVPAVRVRGRVYLPGAENRGVSVNLVPRSGGGRFWGSYAQSPEVNEQGTLESRSVAPGTYQLSAMLYEKVRVLSAREAIEVGSADVDGIALTMQPGIEVAGRVRIEENPEFRFRGLSITFIPRDDPTAGGGGGPVAPDGAFQINPIPQAVYRVSVNQPPDGTYVKSIRFGGEEVLEAGVNLVRRAAFEVILSNKAASVAGVVNNDKGEPMANATVVLIPDEARRSQPQLFRVVPTDQAGRFSLRGVAPGNYRVVAWEEIESGLWMAPDFLATLERKGESIRAEPSGSVSVQLKALPAPN